MSTTFELKGSLFTLTVLRLKSIDLDTLKKELESKITQAPKFFENAPIVIDLQPLMMINPHIDFEPLLALLKTFKLIPIGVRNGTEDHLEAATKAGLAVLPNLKTTEEEPEQKTVATSKPKPTPSTAPSGNFTKVITQPVRSGKQIYAKGGDLLVLAPVSHGAEILADGNIHVYGPLRGRALAGVQGDTSARIFCRHLEAELISIAGHYKISEEMTQVDKEDAQLKHIYLDEDELKITAM